MKMLRLWKLVSIGLILAHLAAEVRANDQDDKAKREKRAAAAFALLERSKQAAVVQVAPPPRVVPEDCLVAVVFVGCVGPDCPGACTLRTENYPGVKAPATLITIPHGDLVHVEKRFEGCPSPAELRKAVKDAAKKIPKPMPAAKEKQSKAPCVCGDSCKCAEGSCPGSCPIEKPAVAQPQPQPCYQWQEVRDRWGRFMYYQLVQTSPSGTAAAAGGS